jgi:hypothetical protein
MKIVKLLDADTYAEMVAKARRDAGALAARAMQTPSAEAQRRLFKRAEAMLGEAIELEMRRLAAARGETLHRVS